MHPILLRLPPVTSYGLMMLVGMVLGWWVARRQARRIGIEPSHVDLMAPLLVLAGLLGAVIFGWWTDAAIAGEAQHGRVLYGALLLAMTTGIGYCLVARFPLGDMGDACAAPVALGIAAGRVGCFLAGCCWGKECGEEFPLGVRFPRGSFAWIQQVTEGKRDRLDAYTLPVHPTQLYEAIGAAAIAVVLLVLIRRRRVAGEIFLWMGISYAALRFSVEFFRADNEPVAGGMTFSQIICLATAAVCVGTLLVRRARARQWRLLRGT